MSNRQQLEQAIAIQESLRGTIDDAIIDATIAALRSQLATLEPPAALESRRAQATILFIDLAGHTNLIQGRDPEEIMELIDQALMRLSVPIERHGGRIVRYQGDGYKAIFGLPTAQEHDPDNAVLAALEILETAGDIATELENERKLPGFQVRVGIDTGLVLIGGGTEGEDAVTGLPVNLAARLEQSAAPGSVLISYHTYQHVRGVFDFQPLDAIVAKGFPHPVPVYRVLRRKPRSFRTRRRGVEGVETRMIGRDDELATLQDMFRRVIEERERLSAIIVGEAGLGKSRLLYEFENWIDLQSVTVLLFRGRSWLETQNLPYGLMRNIFVFRCGIHDDDSAQVVREKLVATFHAVMGENEDTTRKAHLVGHLLGFDFKASPYVRALADDVRQLRGQATFFLTEYYSAATERGPVFLLLEDLHWADDSSLDMIESLVSALAGTPAMVLSAARPTLYERRPGWMDGRRDHQRIDLSYLGAGASDQLVVEILKKVESVPDQLRKMIVERAEGNPFYVEELVKVLIDEGVIIKGDDLWHVQPGKLTTVHIPATLTGVLQARVESLPPAERAALQRASVIGRHFWDTAVEYIGQNVTGETYAKLWPLLRRRELVYEREESAFEGTGEYAFKHNLLRDVTYESVLKRLRRDYHRRAAEWLIKTAGARVEEFADQIAAHYAAAGDNRAEVEWQARVGRAAASRYAAPEALRALGRALELTPPDDPARFELLKLRWNVYHLLGDRSLEAADLDEMEKLAVGQGDVGHQAEVVLGQARYLLAIGAFDQAMTLSEQGHALAEHAGDNSLQARALSYRGNALMFLGNYDEARANLEKALHLAKSIDAKRIQMETVRILGILAEEVGDFDGQNRYYEEALALARELGDRAGERRALNSLGVAALGGGAHDLAFAYYQESLAIARAIGDRVGQGTVLGNMGVQASNLGDYPRARQLFEEALQMAIDADDRTGINVNLLNLAGILSHLGEVDSALARYDEALRGAQETNDRPLIGYILNGIGRALLSGGRASEAQTILRQTLELRLDLGQTHLAAETRAYWCEAMAAEGELPAAVEGAEAVLSFLDNGHLEDVEDEMRVLLSIYRVLRAAGHERATGVLERAYTRLQTVAAMLDESSRRAYLENVPWNREIVALWEGHAGP